MKSYDTLKSLIQQNIVVSDGEATARLLNELKLPELKNLVSGLLRDLYGDNEFFRRAKEHLSAILDFVNTPAGPALRLALGVNKEDLQNDVGRLVESSLEYPLLAPAVLAGSVRNDADAVKEALISHSELINRSDNADRVRESFARYFKARGWDNRAIQSFLPSPRSALPTILKTPVKVAFLVSGQIRGLETAVESWKRYFNVESTSVDVFVSTWLDGFRPSSFSRDRLTSSANRELLDSILDEVSAEELPGRLEKFLPPNRVSGDYLRSVFRGMPNVRKIVTEIEDERDLQGFSNPMKMYYKLNRAFELSRVEGVYDLYVRIRPDIILEGIPLPLAVVAEELVPQKKMLAHYPYVLEYYGFGVDDKIAISRYEVAELYSSTWRTNPTQSMAGHVDLARILSGYDVEVEAIPGLQLSFANYNLPLNLEELRGAL